MPAYPEMYLADAMENLGEMADFAVRELSLDLPHFWQIFAFSPVAEQFAAGSARHILGMSGAELALEVADSAALAVPVRARATGQEACGREDGSGIVHLGSDYWCGWSVAYYQWATAYSFKLIDECVGMKALQKMYPAFHEQSEDRVAEAINEAVIRNGSFSRLKRQRELAGFSQSQLARASGVGLRAIQQYEQGAKNINKASVGNVLALARALHCSPEDLLQPKEHYEYAVVGI